jgi:hypothetical protein
MDDTLPRYKAWETEASLFVTIDVLRDHTGTRHASLEGHTAVAARGLLILVTCAIHYLAHIAEETESTLDPTTLEDLVKSFSFIETRKKGWPPSYVLSFATRSATRLHFWKSGGGYPPA